MQSRERDVLHRLTVSFLLKSLNLTILAPFSSWSSFACSRPKLNLFVCVCVWCVCVCPSLVSSLKGPIRFVTVLLEMGRKQKKKCGKINLCCLGHFLRQELAGQLTPEVHISEHLLLILNKTIR